MDRSSNDIGPKNAIKKLVRVSMAVVLNYVTDPFHRMLLYAQCVTLEVSWHFNRGREKPGGSLRQRLSGSKLFFYPLLQYVTCNICQDDVLFCFWR